MKALTRRGTVVAAAALLAAAARPAHAAYPEKPIRVIVAVNPGGATDVVARTYQQAIERGGLLPQPITVVNVTGAAGAVGLRQVKDAAPDGYTLGLWHTGLLTAAAMGVVDFDHRAFTMIGQVGATDLGFAVKGDAPWRTLAELVAAAKAAPESIRNSTNIGLSVHFLPLTFERAAGARFRYVQAGGGSARLASIMGGHTEFSVFSTAEFIGYGKEIRPLVVFSEARHPLLPDVPTGRELGYDILYNEEQFLFGPPGLPADRAAVIAAAFTRAQADPEVVKRYEEQAMARVFSDAAATNARYDERLAALRPIALDLKKQPSQP